MGEQVLAEGSLTLLLHILDALKKKGVKGAEVLRTEWVEHRVACASGQAQEPVRKSKSRLRFMLFLAEGRSQCLELASESDPDLSAKLDAAMDKARKSDPDPLVGPVDRLDIPSRGLGILDPRYGQVEDEDRKLAINANWQACGQAEGILPTSATYFDRLTHRIYASSRGIHASSMDTLYGLDMAAKDSETGLVQAIEIRSHNFAHVVAMPHGVTLAKSLNAMRGPGTPPSSPLPLVLTPAVTAWILANLAPAFCADRVHDGESLATRLEGKRIGSHRVHVVDDAAHPGGLRTRAFDDRGVPPVPLTVIREGIVGEYYHSPRTARRDEVRPTGHVWGSSLEPSNLVLRHGNRSRTQMLSEVPAALALLEASGSLNLKTGQLDFTSPAFVLEKGKKVGCLSKVRIRMPVQELLAKVKEVASDQQRYSTVDCATILLEPVDFEV